MPNTIEGIKEEIKKVCAQGGSMSHNMLSLLLGKLSKLDKAAADGLFKELCDEGYM